MSAIENPDNTGGSVRTVFIINSFNRLPLLRQCLDSAAKAVAGREYLYGIVVFDAGSTDGSRDELLQFQKASRIACAVLFPGEDRDTSFSAGINCACEKALDRFPALQWLFLYETDNALKGIAPLDLASELLESEKRLGAVGFTVTKHSGERSGYGCRFPQWWHFVLGPQVTFRAGLDTVRESLRTFPGGEWFEADVVFTSPILIRREAWEECGGFDARSFPFADSDLDWAWRMRKLEWKMGVLVSNQVVHDNLEQLSEWSSTRALRWHRSRFLFLQQRVGSVMKLSLPFLLMRHLMEWLFLGILRAGDPRLADMKAQRRKLIRTCLTAYKDRDEGAMGEAS